MKIKDAIQSAINKLKNNNIEETPNKVRMLMAFTTRY